MPFVSQKNHSFDHMSMVWKQRGQMCRGHFFSMSLSERQLSFTEDDGLLAWFVLITFHGFFLAPTF